MLSAYRVQFEKGSPRERNRLCIEDPFEVDYNVARCVTRDGLYTVSTPLSNMVGLNLNLFMVDTRRVYACVTHTSTQARAGYCCTRTTLRGTQGGGAPASATP